MHTAEAQNATSTSTAATDPAPPRAAHHPYIMPHGKTLSQILSESGANAPHFAGRRQPRGTSRSKRWQREFSVQRSHKADLDLDDQEMQAVLRVGRERRRRWMNDKLLRDMAGALTAGDMELLFKPPPFGQEHVSPLAEATSPEYQALWDLFRTIDMDKERRVLQKWEQHLAELQQHKAKEGGAQGSSTERAAFQALRAWAGVSRKARQALKKCSPQGVELLEHEFLQFMEAGQQQELVLDRLEDGFQRLLAHGLAEFHGLSSHSRTAEDGISRITVVQVQGQQVSAPKADSITCADILMLLQANPQDGLDSSMLKQRLVAHAHEQDLAPGYVII